jgi:hypothetical protein
MLSEQTRRDIRLSVLVGTIMATLYSGMAALAYLGNPAETTRRYQVTFLSVIAAYYSAGILGGLVVGFLFRFRKAWAGAFFLGIVSSAITIMCVETALNGVPWLWNGELWFEWGVMTGMFSGVAVYLFLRER